MRKVPIEERQRRISEGLKASWKRRRQPPPSLLDKLRDVYATSNWATLNARERKAYIQLCDVINLLNG